MVNPIAEWSFDEASGTVVSTFGSYDITLTGNNARTAAGSGYTMGGAAPNSKGLTQSAADNQAGPSGFADFNTTSRTVMFWINFGSATTFWAGWEQRRTTEDTGVFGCVCLSGTPEFRAKDSSNNVYNRTFAKDQGNWHHIAATHNGTVLKVYRDGTQVGADIAMAVPVWTATGMRLLDQSGSGTIIDHVRFFNVALDATEINTWMSTVTPTPSSSVDLVIQDARHTTSVDNITITQQHQLVVQESRHTSTADNLNITQNHLLIVQEARHTTTSDNLTLTQFIDLVIQKAVHATKADTFNFTQAHQISIHKSFLQTSSDVVNFLGNGGAVMSVSDVQIQKMATITGQTGSIQDLSRAYYGNLSGLVPISSFSVSDHQRVYWETQTGLNNRSLADLEKAFYDAQLVPSGSLADRELVYWTGL
jgi:hypothetical protein